MTRVAIFAGLGAALLLGASPATAETVVCTGNQIERDARSTSRTLL